MNQEVYAAHMRAYAPAENARMRAGLREEHRHAGGDPGRPPLKLLQAAKTLRQKGFLTASDLGTILRIPKENARALLDRLERAGLATSELHNDARIRIYAFHAPEA